MTLEAISSSELSNLLIYDTISAASRSPHYFDQTIPCNKIGGTGDGFNGKCAPSLLAINASARSQPPSCSSSGRKMRRRRPRNCKNKEEAESQRMTHIAVERNRRRQMNEHLVVLKSLMPESYVQRGDQASIVGGAIDFVKELEQLLQSLEAQKRVLQHQHQHQQQPDGCVNGSLNDVSGTVASDAVPPPFAQFFTYPQYKWCHTPREYMPENHRVAAALADIEVTLVETHTNLRILSPRRPGQLLKMVAGLQALELTILHINVTALDPMVLYSISAKLEEGCNLTSVDDIAAAVHHMLSQIEDEATALS